MYVYYVVTFSNYFTRNTRTTSDSKGKHEIGCLGVLEEVLQIKPTSTIIVVVAR